MEGYRINWFLTRIVTINTILSGMLVLYLARPDLSIWAYFFVSFVCVMVYNILITIIGIIVNRFSDDKWFENRRINIRIYGTILYDKENNDI